MHIRLVLPWFLLATSAACSLLSHQTGFQTPALPLEPGGPVEAGASLGGLWHEPVSASLPGGEGGAESTEPFWTLRGAAHVRVPLTWGTSIRASVSTGRVSTSLAVSVLHPFKPRAPTARWQGAFVWGLGHSFEGASLGALAEGWSESGSIAGHHGVHLGVQGTVGISGRSLWHLGLHTNVPLFTMRQSGSADGADGVPEQLSVSSVFVAETSVATGPAFFIDGPEKRTSVYIMPEIGVGFQLASQATVDPVFVFQVSVGRTQRHRFGASR